MKGSVAALFVKFELLVVNLQDQNQLFTCTLDNPTCIACREGAYPVCHCMCVCDSVCVCVCVCVCVHV